MALQSENNNELYSCASVFNKSFNSTSTMGLVFLGLFPWGAGNN